MAATFDTVFSDLVTSQASPFAYVSNAGSVAGSIGSNSNRVLIAAVQFRHTGGGGITDITGVAVTWAGNSMTAINSTTDTTEQTRIYLFGLKGANVTTGAQTISVSWTGGTTNEITLSGWSYYDADQTTGWQNFNSATATSTNASITITSANGNAVVAALLVNADPAISAGTADWEDSFFRYHVGAHRASTGASTAITYTNASAAWLMAGVDIIAAPAGSSSVSPSASSSVSLSVSPSSSVSPSPSPSTPALTIIGRSVLDYDI
jgi:hypothetical protein